MGKLQLILRECLDEPGTILTKFNKFRNDIPANKNGNKIYQSVVLSHYEQQEVKLATNLTELISCFLSCMEYHFSGVGEKPYFLHFGSIT